MRFLALISILILTQLSWANSELFEKGNSFYSEEKYDSAIVCFEGILEEDNYSFEVFYNLGNAYFKDNQLGKSILNWEKARKIEPTNSMVIENLNHAYALTRDKFEVEIKSEGFIKSFIYEKGPMFWPIISIVLSIIFAVSIFLFFTSKNDSVHQISFYISIISFVCLITFIVFASLQKSYFEESNQAIILSPRVKVMTSPSEGSEESFPLHEGTKVEVVGEDEDWLEIIVNKDNRGWIQKDQVGRF
jgi:tetratricopeptide (TPR) repeat protein